MDNINSAQEMTDSEFISESEDLLLVLRDTLNIDPFVKIELEIVREDIVSECVKNSKSAMSWIIKLNPERHDDSYDICYSIIESLLKVLLSDIDSFSDPAHKKEHIKAIIAKLSTAFCCLLEEEDDEQDSDLEEEYDQ